MALGAGGERVEDAGRLCRGERLETVRGGQGAADQVLVLERDVEEGAGAGDKEPSGTTG